MSHRKLRQENKDPISEFIVRSVAKMAVWLEGIGIAINLIVFSLRPADLKSPDTSRSETSVGKGVVL